MRDKTNQREEKELTSRGQVLWQVVSRVMKRGDQSPTLEWIKPCREILQFAEIHVYRGANCRSENCHTDRNVNTDRPRSHFFFKQEVSKGEEGIARSENKERNCHLVISRFFFFNSPKKMFTRLLIN